MKTLKITDSHLGLFETVSGTIVDLKNPKPDVIHLHDIALSLSNIVRFNGHITPAYTVAHHSILMSYIAPEKIAMHTLLHDAAEAYLGDVVSPLKRILGNTYHELEKRWMDAIAQKFSIEYTPEIMAEIKKCDHIMLQHEYRTMRQDLNYGIWYIVNDEETELEVELPADDRERLGQFLPYQTYAAFKNRFRNLLKFSTQNPYMP